MSADLALWAASGPRELLSTLLQMAFAGHAPSDTLLVRMTDSRVRVLPGDRCRERLESLPNESGPIAAAYRVSCALSKDVLEAAVEDWSGAEPRIWSQSSRLDAEGRWLSSEPRMQALQAESESSNAAIFAESLGMTTGALPKVDAISSPLGAFNAPV